MALRDDPLSRQVQALTLWEVLWRAARDLPVTPSLVATLVTGLEQIRGMERLARILAARGVPTVRAQEPLTGHPDRYVLQFIRPAQGDVFRIAAPMGDPTRLALVAERVGERLPETVAYGRPSEILRALRVLLGWE